MRYFIPDGDIRTEQRIGLIHLDKSLLPMFDLTAITNKHSIIPTQSPILNFEQPIHILLHLHLQLPLTGIFFPLFWLAPGNT